MSAVPPGDEETFGRSRTQPFDGGERTRPAREDGQPHLPRPLDHGGSGAAAPAEDRGRKALWTRLAMAAALVLVVAAVAVFLTSRDDSTDTAADNEVPVASIGPAFGHFGPGGGLEKALKTCGNASIPGDEYEIYNCSFASPHDGFDLLLTEKDPQVQNSTDLPDRVRLPPTDSIVTTEISPTNNSVHAYFLRREGNGEDGTRNTPDDQVTLTLYDVDKSHPGAAVFSAKDSTKDPLTREKADQLLSAIGAKSEQFPLPRPFYITQLKDFASAFVANRPPDDCVRAFSILNREQEHDVCRGGDVTMAFGFVPTARLDDVQNRFRSNTGNAYTWDDDNSGGGSLSTSTFGGSTRLYWDDGQQSYGVLTAKTADRTEKQLIDYFKRVTKADVNPA